MKYTDYINEIEKDPEYYKAKEALRTHFTLGAAILRARIQHGWTQTELAERVGTKQANISRIEAGQGNPTFNLLQKLMDVLELEMNFTPTQSPTTYKTVSFGQPGILVPNWPGSNIQTASNARKHVLFDGGQK